MTNCIMLRPLSQNSGFCYIETCKALATEIPGCTN